MTDAPQTDLSEETTAAPAAVVPDKAALEGLEAKWSAQWKADDTYAFDRTKLARRGLLDRHSPADRVGLAARRATSSPTPTPTWSRASSGCAARRCSTRWAGTTTACRPSAGCRTTSASGATRRCRTTPTSPRPRSPTRSDQVPISRPNFVELCEQLVERGRAGLRGAVAHPRPLGRLEAALHDDRAQGAEGQPARVPAQLRPRRGLPAGGADPLGRHLPDRGRPGRARGAGVRRRTTTACTFHGADGPGRRSRPPVPS